MMHEIFERLIKIEGKMSELLIDSATDEGEKNSLIEPSSISTPSFSINNDKKVYLSKTRIEKIRSKVVIEKIKNLNTKLVRTVIGRKS